MKERAQFRSYTGDGTAVFLAAAIMLVILYSWAPVAHAQDGRTPAGSSPTLEDGNGSQIPGAFMPRWRKIGEEHGVSIALEDTYDFQGNPAGGRTQMGTVFGRSQAVLTLDLTKLLRVPHTTITGSGLFQTGSNLATTYIGAWDLTSSIAGTHTLRVNEYYLQRTFLGERLTVRGGQLAAATEFGNQTMGADDQGAAFKTWINNSLASGLPTVVQVFLAVPPAGKPGLLLRTDPNKHVFIKAAVLSGSHSMIAGDENGTRFDLRNAPNAALSLGWKTDDPAAAHPAIYKIGLVHNFGHFERFGTKAPTQGNDVAFANAGFGLWHLRRPDGSYTRRGVDAQLSATAAPRVLNKNDFETGDGIRLVGFAPRRPSDILAIGILYAHFSRDWSNTLRAQGMPGRDSQSNLEVGYKIALSRWFSLWPDFQYIWKPSGDRRLPDAPVFGMRVVFDH